MEILLYKIQKYIPLHKGQNKKIPENFRFCPTYTQNSFENESETYNGLRQNWFSKVDYTSY
jgi:hypothetical protein